MKSRILTEMIMQSVATEAVGYNTGSILGMRLRQMPMIPEIEAILKEQDRVSYEAGKEDEKNRIIKVIKEHYEWRGISKGKSLIDRGLAKELVIGLVLEKVT